FPDRFMFVELAGLNPAVRRCAGRELDLVILLDKSDPFLEEAVHTDNFALFCTPAINLFPKRADRIHLQEQSEDYHIVPERTRPMDFEVYTITEVTGHGTKSSEVQEFRPFYAFGDPLNALEGRAYYTLVRKPRVLSSKQKEYGSRSGYIGGEVFISLVDADQAPFRSDLRQLGVEVLCTNRDLPMYMSLGQGRTDFTLESGAPVESIRCLSGPTRPRPSFAEGDTSWRLISHLSLNYLSLVDNENDRGAAALRQLLMLYAPEGDTAAHRQIEGVTSIAAKPITRWVAINGPRALVRGLEVTLTCDETCFEGIGVFLIGAVLERFFSRYVSINSFTETVIKTKERGEVMLWPARIGRRHTL
ncbi:MAG: type VI secretion system baseplate subunit TssF, partial [Planctomycetes bacterium]|nr:type VI secretion system baseplate subunit TssF [Planctomycetota bacterium]